MEVDEATELVKRLSVERAELVKTIEVATRQAKALGKIILGYQEMYPELAQVVAQAGWGNEASEPFDEDERPTPRGAEAVRVLLHEAPDQDYLVSDLVRIMKQRGWLPDSDNPANAVRAALERLIATPETDVYKRRQGQYVVYSYQPDLAPPEPKPTGYAYDEEPF